MGLELKYKVVNKYLKQIEDIEIIIGDRKDPVRIAQPLSCSYNEYLDFSQADDDEVRDSIKHGLLRNFIRDGHVLAVYVEFDKDGKVVSEIPRDEYEGIHGKPSDVSKGDSDLSKVLKDNGFEIGDVVNLLKKLKTGEADLVFRDKPKEEVKSDLVEVKRVVSTSNSEVKPNEIIISCEDFLKLKYQQKLQALKNINDKVVLQEILKVEKLPMIIKRINKKLGEVK